VRLRRRIDVAEPRAASGSHGAPARIDRDRVQRREVDDEAVVAGRVPGNA
jgi:hypothetical protein